MIILYLIILFFPREGLVYTCGINDAQQLGHSSKTGSTVLSPTLLKSLKSKKVRLIGAGRYHTAVATSNQVLSFGTNYGQLGHQKSTSTQPNPKIVSFLIISTCTLYNGLAYWMRLIIIVVV